MTNWLQRARAEIPKGPTRLTANSDVRSPNEGETVLTSLLAVGHTNPFAGIRTSEQDAEIRTFIGRFYGDHPDTAEALAIALRMPDEALASFRADVAEGRPWTKGDA